MKKICYVSQYEKLYDIITNRSKTIKDFHILDEGMVAIEYVKSKEFLEMNTNTNVIIASFCTAYARLKLWNVMIKLGDHIIYHMIPILSFTVIIQANGHLPWGVI